MESAVNLEVSTLNFENLTIFFSPGGEAAHELWEPPQLRLPHLSPGQEPLATHFPSSYFKVLDSHLKKGQNRTNVVLLNNLFNPQPKDCASWRGGDEDGLVENASADQPQSEKYQDYNCKVHL